MKNNQWAKNSSVQNEREEKNCSICKRKVKKVGGRLPDGRPLCQLCAERIAEESSPVQLPALGNFVAFFAGMAGAILGASTWILITQFTQIEVGYLAILVGFFAGKAISLYSGVARSRFLPYISMACAFVGLVAAKFILYLLERYHSTHLRTILTQYVDRQTMQDFSQNFIRSFSAFQLLWVLIALAVAYKLAKNDE